MDTSEILDFIDGKLLLKSNVDFFSPALSLKRGDTQQRGNGRLVKDVSKCLNNSDIFDTMNVMMQI